MNKDLNLGIVVEANNVYTSQLIHILKNCLYSRFSKMYEDVSEITERKTDRLIEFQKELQKIPHWNDSIIDNEIANIKGTCNFIDDLISAIFVGNVKILSSVKIRDSNEKLKIKMPTTEKFLHKVFWNSAENIYNNAKDIFSLSKIETNKEKVQDLIEEAIQNTITTMLPFENILQTYLGSVFDPSSPVDDEEHSNNNDNLIPDDDEEQEIENEDSVLPDPDPENESEEPTESQTGFFENPNEVKNLTVTDKNTPISKKPELFPDAIDE